MFLFSHLSLSQKKKNTENQGFIHKFKDKTYEHTYEIDFKVFLRVFLNLTHISWFLNLENIHVSNSNTHTSSLVQIESGIWKTHTN